MPLTFKQEKELAFLKSMTKEKILHKEHRVELLKQKMTFMVGLLTIGAISKITDPIYIIFKVNCVLYFIPFIMMSFDLYLFAEDFKVKRIGVFLQIEKECKVCKQELNWERWLNTHREPLARWTSLVVTVLASTLSAIIIFKNRVPLQSIYEIFQQIIKICFTLIYLIIQSKSYYIPLDVFKNFPRINESIFAYWICIVLIVFIIISAYGLTLNRRLKRN
jgi:hypothetical protein